MANSGPARITAADRLSAEFVELRKNTFPSSPIIAVSYSHGGNVVTAASTRLEVDLDAAIFLNTPFLHVSELSEPSTPRLRTLLVILAGLAALPVMPLFHLDVVPPYAAKRWVAIGTFLLAWAVCALHLNRVVPRINSTRDRMARCTHPRISRSKSVFVIGDEIASMFGLVHSLQWAAMRVSPILAVAVLANVAVGIAHVVPQQWTELIHGGLLLVVGGLFFAHTLGAMSAYGLVQGLIALDSPTAVTPAPLGYSHFTVLRIEAPKGMHHKAIARSAPEIVDLIIQVRTELGFVDADPAYHGEAPQRY